MLDSIPWNSDDPSNKCLIYSAHYSKKVDHILNIPNRYIIAGGGGNDTNEIKIFEAASKRVVASVRGLSAAVYSVDTSPDGSLLALGGGGKELMVYDWNDHHSQDA